MNAQPLQRMEFQSGFIGRLTLPSSAQVTAVFAHGSGSSRHSPPNA